VVAKCPASAAEDSACRHSNHGEETSTASSLGSGADREDGVASVITASSNKDFPLSPKKGFVGPPLDDPPNPEKIRASLKYLPNSFNTAQCDVIESWLDHTAWCATEGMMSGPKTVDETPHRTKMFFGHGYSYGRDVRGQEEVLPLGSVDPIPDWAWECVVRPLEQKGIIKPGWVNSVVINDYREGSCIVSHVDPIRLFARPIVTVTMFCPAKLVFGASFDPERRTPPAHSQLLHRGSVLVIDGYAANRVTHGIRPEDLLGCRRVSMVLRHVHDDVVQEALAKQSEELSCKLFQEGRHSEALSAMQGHWQGPPSNPYASSSSAPQMTAPTHHPHMPAPMPTMGTPVYQQPYPHYPPVQMPYPQMHPHMHPQMHPQMHPYMHPQMHPQMHPHMHPHPMHPTMPAMPSMPAVPTWPGAIPPHPLASTPASISSSTAPQQQQQQQPQQQAPLQFLGTSPKKPNCPPPAHPPDFELGGLKEALERYPKHSQLLQKVQGLWQARVAAGNEKHPELQGKLYFVFGLHVVVLSGPKKSKTNFDFAALSAELQKQGDASGIVAGPRSQELKVLARWRLGVTDNGVVCNSSFLDVAHARNRSLGWRVLNQNNKEPKGEKEKQKQPSYYTWLRAGAPQ